ncbi:MAG: HEAT repeat domain-containing protein [Gemmataceae bacterium]
MRWKNSVGLMGILTVLISAVPVHAIDQDEIRRSIDSGISALKAAQKPNGFWIYGEDQKPSSNSIGATALAGLALLESGVPADDKAVQMAAQVARVSCVDLTQTYSLSLCIIFLDRLGDKNDEAFIRNMTAKIVAGQLRNGMWSYNCPGNGAKERTELITALKASSEATKKPNNVEGKRNAQPGDQTREIEQQLLAIASANGLEASRNNGDNSNTQFALLALWVARRHDLPVDKSLALVDAHFRTTQSPDGGWGYTGGSTPSMTCAGLLGLAVGNVAASTSLKTRPGKKDTKENKDNKEPKDDKRTRPDKPRKDLGKDPAVMAGFRYLGAALAGKLGMVRGLELQIAGGKVRPMAPQDSDYFAYYFLWSLERVAVAYSIDSIGNTDWYEYGAQQLLKNQKRNGAWYSARADGMVNTSFALLFLSRSNLVRDLTTALKGSVQDPEKVAKKAPSGEATTPKADRKPLEGKPLPPPEAPQDPDARGPATDRETAIKPAPSAAPQAEAARLGNDLVKAPAARQEQLLDQFRQAKGNEYTASLAKAIRQLDGDSKKKSRQALADRLATMTSTTLGEKLSDADLEIRRAAAIACAMKEDKSHIPRLIELLEDSEAAVNRAAHAALKSLTSQDFGPAKSASPEEVVKAATAWKTWWKENSSK